MINDDTILTIDTLPLALTSLKVRFFNFVSPGSYIVNINDIVYGLFCDDFPMFYISRRSSSKRHLPKKYGVKELFETINAVNSGNHQVKVIYTDYECLEFRLYQTEESYTSFCKHFFDYIQQLEEAIKYFDEVRKMLYEEKPADPMSLYLGHIMDADDEMYDEERIGS